LEPESGRAPSALFGGSTFLPEGEKIGSLDQNQKRQSMERDEEEPVERSPGAEPEAGGRTLRRRQDALSLLLKAREHLIAQMTDEILTNRDAILGDPSQTGLFGFEFQEIEDRYIGRLNAINSILDNLEHRSARILNRTEVVFTNRKRVKKDLDDLIARYDQWDIVTVNAMRLSEDQLMLIVAFTADEFGEEGAGEEEREEGSGDSRG
jgi:hypothetical protein